MAAPAETAGKPSRKTRAEARRSEKVPSGGWRTIAGKELTDHIVSWRFIILLAVITLVSFLPIVFTSGDFSSQATAASQDPRLFLLMFTFKSQTLGNFTMVVLVGLILPIVGIAFGFDGVNSERSQGTLSRLLAQPVHRDDVINGKFAAGIAVVAVMMVTLILLVTALGILRLGIIPTAEQIARIVIWLLVTVLYASFWLAFALLLSVTIRSTATAALVGFGVWFGTTLIGSIILPIVAGFLFPIDATASIAAQASANGAQNLIQRLSPAQLYQDINRAVLDPLVNSLFIGNSGQFNSANDPRAIPSLLTIDQSVLLVMPQILVLVAMTVALFALAYVLFLRQEVRA
jgi:ABC-2 type transport system permease protein